MNYLDDIPGLPVKPAGRKQPPASSCVSYTVPRCPQCGSSHCPTYSSDGPLKWRKCAACGASFKSFVLNWKPEDQKSESDLDFNTNS
jgi:hypothetical protein